MENLVQEEERKTETIREREREKQRGNRQDEKRRRAKIGRRLWLWTTDHQRGLAHGPDHRRDLVGRTDLARSAPGEKNLPERNHASACTAGSGEAVLISHGVAQSWGYWRRFTVRVLHLFYTRTSVNALLPYQNAATRVSRYSCIIVSN